MNTDRAVTRPGSYLSAPALCGSTSEDLLRLLERVSFGLKTAICWERGRSVSLIEGTCDLGDLIGTGPTIKSVGWRHECGYCCECAGN
jgi:hypothetical protein